MTSNAPSKPRESVFWQVQLLPLPQGSVGKIRAWSCWAGCWPLPKVYPSLSPMTTPCHFFLSGPRAIYEWKTQGVGHRVLGKITLPGEVPVGHRLGSDIFRITVRVRYPGSHQGKAVLGYSGVVAEVS